MHSELIMTEDGSHSLYVPSLDESYHSTHGAIQESQHIFIDAGLNECTKSDIHILEIGFGTGLNAFLSFIEADKHQLNIHYTTLEKYPVALDLISQLNYADAENVEYTSVFKQLHTTSWNKKIKIHPRFTLHKIATDFTQYEFDEKYDLIFFDAFSPEKQAEMWTEELFSKLYKQANDNAILTTYCAKGAVRRALQGAGFTVERIPGPPGKREILRARKL